MLFVKFYAILRTLSKHMWIEKYNTTCNFSKMVLPHDILLNYILKEIQKLETNCREFECIYHYLANESILILQYQFKCYFLPLFLFVF